MHEANLTGMMRFTAVFGLAIACAGGTTGMNPSVPERSLAPCPNRPNCVSSLAEDVAHRVDPLALRVPLERAWPQLRDAVASLPRTRIVETGDGYLRAEATSRLFRFVDDLEVLHVPGTVRIDVRSASRVGYSDLGVNRARVESLRETLRGAGLVE
jgi:uncharacterized protein (DUF1499 family)